MVNSGTRTDDGREPAEDPWRSQRILVVAPFGKDAEILCRQFVNDGLQPQICASIDDLCHEIRQGAALAVVTEETLTASARRALHGVLEKQPTWSDFPLLVLLSHDSQEHKDWHILEAFAEAAQVTLLERPLSVATLASIVRAAMQSRQRQYQIRDELVARRRAEDELRERHAQFQMLAELSPDAILVRTEDRFVFANRAAIRLLDMESADELFQAAPSQSLSVDCRETVKEKIEAAFASRRITAPMECRWRRRDGAILDIELVAGPVEWNQQPAVQIVIRDITQRKRVETELRDANERFRVASKTVPLILAQTDKELRYRWLHNPHPDFESVPVLGKRDDELQDSTGMSELLAAKRFVLEAGRPLRREITFQLSNGARTYEWTIEPIRDAAGAVVGVTMAGLDITQRKWTEQQLQKLNASLEQLVTQRTAALAMLHDMAAMANAATDVDTAVRNVLERISREQGWKCGLVWLPLSDSTDAALVGSAWYERAPRRYDRLSRRIMSAQVAQADSLAGRVFLNGRPEITEQIAAPLSIHGAQPAEYQGLEFAVAFPILAADKTVGVLQLFAENAIPLTGELRDAMDSVGTLLGRVVEREQARRELRRSEQELRAILNAAPDAIVAIDRHGMITRVNPATEHVFGYRAGELLGSNVKLLMPAPYRDEHGNYLERYLRYRQAHIIGKPRELRASRKDGHVFPIELAVNEIDSSGVFVGIIRDISARKRLEKLVVEAVAEEQRRIGQDIHDGLGQELTGLRYMARTLAESLAREGSPDAATAERISQWTLTVQRQLRAIIRQLVPVEVDEQGLVTALQSLADRITETCQLHCTLQCEREIAVSDTTLATQLYRIAQEAVRNAQRHARASRIHILFTETQSGMLKLQVSDNGVGIGSSAFEDPGVGIRSMAYRADLIAATLDIRQGNAGGTEVTCIVARSPRTT